MNAIHRNTKVILEHHRIPTQRPARVRDPSQIVISQGIDPASWLLTVHAALTGHHAVIEFAPLHLEGTEQDQIASLGHLRHNLQGEPRLALAWWRRQNDQLVLMKSAAE